MSLRGLFTTEGRIRTHETFVDLEGQLVRRSGQLFSIRISLCFVEMLFRHRFALKSDAISVSLVPVEGAVRGIPTEMLAI